MDDLTRMFLGIIAAFISFGIMFCIGDFVKLHKVSVLHENGFTSDQISCIVYYECKGKN